MTVSVAWFVVRKNRCNAVETWRLHGDGRGSYGPVTARFAWPHPVPGDRVSPYAGVVSVVVIVEDDPTLASVVVSYLERAGHSARCAATGPAGLAMIAAGVPDLVLLDVMLPELDGLEVCRRLRAAYPDLAVMMLTALGEVDDRIAGLEVGADDYVTKPFSPRELVLRVEALLRRSGVVAPARPSRAGRHSRAGPGGAARHP